MSLAESSEGQGYTIEQDDMEESKQQSFEPDHIAEAEQSQGAESTADDVMWPSQAQE